MRGPKKLPVRYYYALLGGALGVFFPLLAINLKNNAFLLLGIIDTAPLVLSTFGFFIGARQTYAERDRVQNILIESMNEGMIVRNSLGKVIQFNQKALELLNLSKDELMSSNTPIEFKNAIGEDNSQIQPEDYLSLMGHQMGRTLEKTIGLRSLSSDVRWIRVSATPLQLHGERHVISTYSDITALIHAKRESIYILNAVGVGVWQLNPVTQELKWDRSMFRLYEENEATDPVEIWARALTLEGQKKVWEELQIALAGEKDFNTTFEIQTAQSGVKIITAQARIIRNEKKRTHNDLRHQSGSHQGIQIGKKA